MTLHFSQRGFTEACTFMYDLHTTLGTSVLGVQSDKNP
jgi:hypothetical protein